MKTLFKVEITPVWVDGSLPEYSEMKDNIIYISEKYNGSNHKCLCGCGEEVYLTINRENKWQIIKEEDDKISILGSVGNYGIPCKSHYIITKNVANFV